MISFTGLGLGRAVQHSGSVRWGSLSEAQASLDGGMAHPLVGRLDFPFPPSAPHVQNAMKSIYLQVCVLCYKLLLLQIRLGVNKTTLKVSFRISLIEVCITYAIFKSAE